MMTTINKIVYQDLIHAAALQYKKHSSVMAQTLSVLLEEFDITKSSTTTCNHNFSIPSHTKLEAIVQSKSHPLLANLSDCLVSFAWRPSGFGKLPAGITNHIAVVEIVGPSGMIEDQRFRFGLLMQDPNIQYAEHQHAAEELYLVLSGESKWAVDRDQPTTRLVGEFIHHAENQPHQMQTSEEPMLAMWAWLGDISAESYSI